MALRDIAPGPGQSMEQFLTIGYRPHKGARQWMDFVTALSAKLDGVRLVPNELTPPPSLSPFRATSPMFEVRGHPSFAQWDPCITGREQPAVADGYWIMLNPLPRGKHKLDFSGTVGPPINFSLAVTYNLLVR